MGTEPASVPCPMCDAEELSAMFAASPGTSNVAMCVALGVGVGTATRTGWTDQGGALHAITRAMCTKHRTPYVLAMAQVAAYCATKEQLG